MKTAKKYSIKNLFKKLKKNLTKQQIMRSVYQVTAFIVSLILVYCVANYAVMKSYHARKLVLNDNFTISAQTGSMNTKANSLESILRSVEAGANVVEFDVNFRPDKTPVMSNEYIITNNEGVLVEDALRLVSQYDDIDIYIDIRSTTNLKKVQDLIIKYDLVDRVYLTGVNDSNLEQVQKQCAQLKYYYDYSPNRSRMISDKYKAKILTKLQNTGAIGINCKYMYANARLSDLLHENGYKLSIYSVNTVDQMARCLSFVPDNITTNEPDILLNLIENWRIIQ